MPYNPKGFNDVGGDATMAPSELQPPLNFADGGAVSWAGDTTVYNTQSQLGNMLATPGGFGSMATQFTGSAPFDPNQSPFSGYQDSNQTQEQEQGYDFNLGTILQPMPQVAPPLNPTIGSFSTDAYNSITPPLSGGNINPPEMEMPVAEMAKGGNVSNLINRLHGEFSKRGLDMNKMIAHRKAYAYGGDVRGGDNPGGLSGDTGAYSGRSIGSSQSVNAAMGRESPAQRDVSYGGGGGGNDRGDRGSSTPSPAAARAAEEASMAALKDVMATSPAALMPASLRDVYSQANYQSDLLNRQRAEQNAAQADYETQRNLSLEGLKNLPDPILSISPAVAAKQAIEKAAMTYRGVNPNEAFGEPFGEFETQPSPLEAQVVDKLAKLRAEGEQIRQAQAARPVNPNEAYGGTPQEFEGQPSPFDAYSRVKTVPTSPFESVVKSMTNLASMSDAAKGSLIDAARQKPQPTVFTQPSPTEDIYSYTPPLTAKPVAQAVVEQPVVTTTSSEPAPVTEEVAAPVKAAPVFTAAAAKKTAAAPAVTTQATKPADQGVLGKIMADINNANAKRIAELEKAGEFAGGSKADVAAALNVDPSELQSRIVNYDGRQKVDYFTKGLDQALAEMVTGPFQAIGNLFGSNVNQTPRGSYVRDPRFSDLFSQNVPSKGYGPYGDLTLEEYNKQYGGGNQQAGAGAPVTTPNVPVTSAPEVPATPLASFKRKYIPLTEYANYGYGPESTFYEYQAAQGGSVGPLSQKRK